MKMVHKLVAGAFGLLCFLLACGGADHTVADNSIIITYLCQTDSARYVGTILNQGSSTSAAWSVTRDGVKESQDREIPDATMAELWMGLNEIEDFHRFSLTDPTQPLDFNVGHVIMVLSGTPGERDTRTFLIPFESASSEFKEWLVLAGLPDR